MTRTIAWAGCLFFVATLAAFPARAQEVPFTGIVVQDNVPVRAGAGKKYYIVGQLDKGTRVHVDFVFFGWNKIRCPKSVYSYISKAFVNARGDGTTGTVSMDGTEVEAASIKGPGESYSVQVVLNAADTVQIVEEVGSFYKIIPPAGAYVFLPPDSVRRETDADLAAEQPIHTDPTVGPTQPDGLTAIVPLHRDPTTVFAQDGAPLDGAAVKTAHPWMGQTVVEVPIASVAATGPAVTGPAPQLTAESAIELIAAEPAAEPAVESAVEIQAPPTSTTAIAARGDPGHTVATESAEQPQQRRSAEAPADSGLTNDPSKGANVRLTADSASLRDVEYQMFPLFLMPLENQPLDQMIASYEGLDLDKMSAADRQIVALRLATLRRNNQVAFALQQIVVTKRQITEAEAQFRAESDTTTRYDAVGKLMASSVYDGKNLPRMFRLVEPTSGRTVAWVEPSDVVNVVEVLGRLVGITGRKQYDTGLNRQLLEIDRISLLEPTP